MTDLQFWLALVISILEVVGRAWPDPRVKGISGYVIDVIKFVSDLLNKEKPY